MTNCPFLALFKKHQLILLSIIFKFNKKRYAQGQNILDFMVVAIAAT